jgi:hypothetical protein
MGSVTKGSEKTPRRRKPRKTTRYHEGGFKARQPPRQRRHANSKPARQAFEREFAAAAIRQSAQRLLTDARSEITASCLAHVLQMKTVEIVLSARAAGDRGSSIASRSESNKPAPGMAQAAAA